MTTNQPDPYSDEIRAGNLPPVNTVQLRTVVIADRSQRWAFNARCGTGMLAVSPKEANRG